MSSAAMAQPSLLPVPIDPLSTASAPALTIPPQQPVSKNSAPVTTTASLSSSSSTSSTTTSATSTTTPSALPSGLSSSTTTAASLPVAISPVVASPSTFTHNSAAISSSGHTMSSTPASSIVPSSPRMRFGLSHMRTLAEKGALTLLDGERKALGVRQGNRPLAGTTTTATVSASVVITSSPQGRVSQQVVQQSLSQIMASLPPTAPLTQSSPFLKNRNVEKSRERQNTAPIHGNTFDDTASHLNVPKPAHVDILADSRLLPAVVTFSSSSTSTSYLGAPRKTDRSQSMSAAPTQGSMAEGYLHPHNQQHRLSASSTVLSPAFGSLPLNLTPSTPVAASPAPRASLIGSSSPALAAAASFATTAGSGSPLSASAASGVSAASAASMPSNALLPPLPMGTPPADHYIVHKTERSNSVATEAGIRTVLYHASTPSHTLMSLPTKSTALDGPATFDPATAAAASTLSIPSPVFAHASIATASSPLLASSAISATSPFLGSLPFHRHNSISSSGGASSFNSSAHRSSPSPTLSSASVASPPRSKRKGQALRSPSWSDRPDNDPGVIFTLPYGSGTSSSSSSSSTMQPHARTNSTSSATFSPLRPSLTSFNSASSSSTSSTAAGSALFGTKDAVLAEQVVAAERSEVSAVGAIAMSLTATSAPSTNYPSPASSTRTNSRSISSDILPSSPAATAALMASAAAATATNPSIPTSGSRSEAAPVFDFSHTPASPNERSGLGIQVDPAFVESHPPHPLDSTQVATPSHFLARASTADFEPTTGSTTPLFTTSSSTYPQLTMNHLISSAVESLIHQNDTQAHSGHTNNLQVASLQAQLLTPFTPSNKFAQGSEKSSSHIGSTGDNDYQTPPTGFQARMTSNQEESVVTNEQESMNVNQSEAGESHSTGSTGGASPSISGCDFEGGDIAHMPLKAQRQLSIRRQSLIPRPDFDYTNGSGILPAANRNLSNVGGATILLYPTLLSDVVEVARDEQARLDAEQAALEQAAEQASGASKRKRAGGNRKRGIYAVPEDDDHEDPDHSARETSQPYQGHLADSPPQSKRTKPNPSLTGSSPTGMTQTAANYRRSSQSQPHNQYQPQLEGLPSAWGSPSDLHSVMFEPIMTRGARAQAGRKKPNGRGKGRRASHTDNDQDDHDGEDYRMDEHEGSEHHDEDVAHDDHDVRTVGHPRATASTGTRKYTKKSEGVGRKKAGRKANNMHSAERGHTRPGGYLEDHHDGQHEMSDEETEDDHQLHHGDDGGDVHHQYQPPQIQPLDEHHLLLLSRLLNLKSIEDHVVHFDDNKLSGLLDGARPRINNEFAQSTNVGPSDTNESSGAEALAAMAITQASDALFLLATKSQDNDDLQFLKNMQAFDQDSIKQMIDNRFWTAAPIVDTKVLRPMASPRGKKSKATGKIDSGAGASGPLVAKKSHKKKIPVDSDDATVQQAGQKRSGSDASKPAGAKRAKLAASEQTTGKGKKNAVGRKGGPGRKGKGRKAEVDGDETEVDGYDYQSHHQHPRRQHSNAHGQYHDTDHDDFGAGDSDEDDDEEHDEGESTAYPHHAYQEQNQDGYRYQKGEPGAASGHSAAAKKKRASKVKLSGSATKETAASKKKKTAAAASGLTLKKHQRQPSGQQDGDDEGENEDEDDDDHHTTGKAHPPTSHTSSSSSKRCEACECTTTPCWRPGHSVGTVLCNSCGLRFKKSMVYCPKAGCKHIPLKSEFSAMEINFRERLQKEKDAAAAQGRPPVLPTMLMCKKCGGPVAWPANRIPPT